MLSLTKENNNARIAYYTRPGNRVGAIYLHDDVTKPPITNRSNLVDYVDKTLFQKGRYPISQEIIDAVFKLIRTGQMVRPHEVNPNVYQYYSLIMRDINTRLPYHYIAEIECRFYCCPTLRNNQRDFIIVTGPSGVGKSWWAADYCVTYHHTHPERKVYLFSGKNTDEAFDKIKDVVTRLPREEWSAFMGNVEAESEGPKRKRRKVEFELPADTNDVSVYANTLFVFDDIDDILPEALKRKVYAFKEFLTRLGRSSGIDLVLCNHLHLDYHKTRSELNECTAVVLFPRSSTIHHMQRYMKEHLGLDKDNINKIIDEKYKWAMLYTQHPMAVITQQEMWLLKRQK